MQQGMFNLETEFDIMFKKVVLGFGRFFSPESIRLGRRVGETFQDVSIHSNYKNKDINETRAIICIEVKKTETSGLKECIEHKRTKKLEESVRQALGYAYANFYVRNSIILKPVCILTDGDYIAFLDSDESPEKNLRTLAQFPESRIFTFDEKIIKDKFSDLVNKTVEELVGPEKSISRPHAIEATRSESTCDSKLARDLVKTYTIFTHEGIKPEIAIDYTMQCFLLLVLRNCGFISISEMDTRVAEHKDQEWVHATLQKYFSGNFEEAPKTHMKLFIQAYLATHMYDVRVDAMPQEELGYAYEAFIRQTNRSKTTEFYTPDNLIKEVLVEVKPTIEDIIYDPTCGCGSFLIAAVRYIFDKQINNFEDFKRLGKFLSNNVFGNDRDFYASCIAKAALLSLFVERLGIDPTVLKLKLPLVRDNFTTEDYFNLKWKSKKKPTLVVGNAPWGDVSSDSKKFKEIIGTKDVWDKIQIVRGRVDDRHELSGSVVLKCLDDFGNGKNFRLGLLIKQQILVNGKDKFLEDDRSKACYFFDYGYRQMFKHTASLTAIAFYAKNNKKGIMPQFPLPATKFGPMVSLRDLGCSIRKGPDTGKNHIWLELAENKSLESLVVECLVRDGNIKPLSAPDTISMVYIAPPNKINVKDPEYAEKHALLETHLSASQKKELLGVTTGSKNKKGVKEKKSKNGFPFTWRRPLDNHLLTDGSWKLIIPFQWTGVEIGSSRLPLACTNKPVVIRDCHVCVTFPEGMPNELIVNTAAWMASKYFSESLELLCAKQSLKRLSGGYELNPSYCEQVFVPFAVLNSSALHQIAKDVIGKRVVSDSSLLEIDKKIAELLKVNTATEFLDKGKAELLLMKASNLLEKAKQKNNRKKV